MLMKGGRCRAVWRPAAPARGPPVLRRQAGAPFPVDRATAGSSRSQACSSARRALQGRGGADRTLPGRWSTASAADA